ncbi:MAG: FecR domain-containing protein, partial [Bacteroidota bacterium]
MQDKTLIKYIKGEANPAEKQRIMEWIKKDAAHQKRYNRLKAQYVASTLDTLTVPDIDARYREFASRRVRKRTYYYAAVAALIALPLTIWSLYTLLPGNTSTGNPIQFSNKQTIAIATQTGDRKKVTLPDGSTVILNAESSLTYPKNFTDSIRQVTLTGEAFFDIKRNTTQPFIVKTEYLSVKVLGTAFNVKSYSGD